MTLPVLAQQTLFLFGLGFLGANVKVAVDTDIVVTVS